MTYQGIDRLMCGLRTTTAVIALLACFPRAACAQDLQRRCSGVFDLCGYVDAAGVEVIPNRFEDARPFRHGLAAVRLEGRWGFIRPTGEVVVEPRFQAVGDFKGARAEVVVEGQAGIIDQAGRFVIPPKFGRAFPFTDDVALVSEKKANTSVFGEFLLYDSISSSDRYRIYHHQSGYLTQEPRRFEWFGYSKTRGANLIWAAGLRPDDPYGLMDDRGNWVVQPQFRYAQALIDGRAVVTGPSPGDHAGAVDENGEIVIPLKYHWLSYFDNGYALLGGAGNYKSRKQGLIRADGTIVAEPVFDDAKHPEGNQAPLVKRDGTWYEVGPDGSLSTSPRSLGGPVSVLMPSWMRNAPDGRVLASCPQGLTVKRQGPGYALEDADGRSSFSESAMHVSFAIRKSDGSISGRELSSERLDCRAPINVGFGDVLQGTDRWTYVRSNGRPLFEPGRFFSALDAFQSGHAVVGTARRSERGEWGIIDTEGRFTLPLQPEPVRSKSVPDVAAVFILGKGEGRLTDAQGRPVPEIEKALDRSNRQNELRCPSGSRIVGDGERFGLVGPGGEILVPAVHRAVTCYRNGVAWAPRDELRVWCPIGVNGRFHSDVACMSVGSRPMMVFHASQERFSDDHYENGVLWEQARLRYGMGLRDQRPRLHYSGPGGRF